MAGMFEQIQVMQKLMKDENFRKLMAHPKVQELFKDPEFVSAVQSQDSAKLMANPKLAALQAEPELRELISKLNLGQIFGQK